MNRSLYMVKCCRTVSTYQVAYGCILFVSFFPTKNNCSTEINEVFAELSVAQLFFSAQFSPCFFLQKSTGIENVFFLLAGKLTCWAESPFLLHACWKDLTRRSSWKRPGFSMTWRSSDFFKANFWSQIPGWYNCKSWQKFSFWTFWMSNSQGLR